MLNLRSIDVNVLACVKELELHQCEIEMTLEELFEYIPCNSCHLERTKPTKLQDHDQRLLQGTIFPHQFTLSKGQPETSRRESADEPLAKRRRLQ